MFVLSRDECRFSYTAILSNRLCMYSNHDIAYVLLCKEMLATLILPIAACTISLALAICADSSYLLHAIIVRDVLYARWTV
jgi:hypothetical protein